MKLRLQSLFSLAILSLCCVLNTVKETDSAFVPARCMCPQTQPRVRGQLKELKIYLQSNTCNNVTVIVTLKRNNKQVCLNPEAPLGKQLIRCWTRIQELGRNATLCLQRKRVRGSQHQRPRQRRRGQNRRVSS